MNGRTGRPDRRAASSMGSGGGQHGRALVADDAHEPFALVAPTGLTDDYG